MISQSRKTTITEDDASLTHRPGPDNFSATPMRFKTNSTHKSKTCKVFRVANWLKKKRLHQNTYLPK
jgi:hypothetical protein